MSTECLEQAFHFENGRLFCESVALEEIAERFETPTYVYSRGAIANNYRQLEAALSPQPRLICYSVKANSNLSILSTLREMGAGFDIVSGGELARVVRVGADPRRVVFSGVGKTVEEMDAALASAILMFNVETEGELELLAARAQALERRAPVAMRVNPDVEAETHPYIATGQVHHKFGVPKKEAIELYRRAAASPHLEVCGIACHIGSQILQVEPFLAALGEILAVTDTLRQEKIALRYLDLGGGYGIRYAAERPLDFQELGKGLTAKLAGRGYMLIVEPGRAIVGNAGVLLARVLYVKRNQHKTFVILDAGMSDLIRPTLYGSYHEIVAVEKRGSQRWVADVVGPLCETGDFLAQDREMEEVRPGDLVAVLTAGAYGYVLASNYNTRPRPAEVLVDGARAQLVRRRETHEDLMAGEESGRPAG